MFLNIRSLRVAMNDTVRKDILRVLADAVDALQRHDFLALAETSNHTIHNAMIYQDEDSLVVAVLVFALGKVEQRFYEEGKTPPKLAPMLLDADRLLAGEDEAGYRRAIRSILAEIATLDEKLHLYIEEVLQKARLKKGSKLHEHGISIARAAEMLGISQWELMSYVGKTSIPDVQPAREDARKRYKAAKRLFS